MRDLLQALTAVANGDFTVRLPVEKGDGILSQIAQKFNELVERNDAMAREVARVEQVVRREGLMTTRASMRGAGGDWRLILNYINSLIGGLTQPAIEIARVISAVAEGDLSQKMPLEIDGEPAKGEFLRIGATINAMVDQRGSFADEVARVAKEVGTDGKLGGQAQVKGVSGTWKDLTESVNQLADNLTAQVRTISDVATAVTKGDLTRTIRLEGAGEVAALSDNINQMIVNLRETAQKNTEQDWLKTNLAKFSSMMQRQKNLESASAMIMSELTPLVSAHYGAFFLMEREGDTPILKLTNIHGCREGKGLANRFRLGESLVGQCALEKKCIVASNVPRDYIEISPGLRSATPLNIIVLPILFEGEVKAVIELASLIPFSATHRLFLDQLSESIGLMLNMVMANMRTDQLLRQSQSLARELRNQSKELTQQRNALRTTNAALERQALELEEKAKLLSEQKAKVEIRNNEAEQARSSLEEKAARLAVVSKYKSEFLANMSHELRTPLNSLLILAKVMCGNAPRNLTEKQLEYARTIYSSGTDLMKLINEVLDLSKIEAGKMEADLREVVLSDVVDFVTRTFEPVAEQKALAFTAEMDQRVPKEIGTDQQRLEQVLKNLLANAFKFTNTGFVRLRIEMAKAGQAFENESLKEAEKVVAMAVTDSGIGIPKDKQKLIFEAFQQADGGISRKYGGTGLGLSISREIARVLGGEIQVESSPGSGSKFVLYLPVRSLQSIRNAGDEKIEPGTQPIIIASGKERGGPADAIVAGTLTGKKVLIVDDDARNIFSISHLLEAEGMTVLSAAGGRAGIELINRCPDIDIVLMDIMMPELDGYETMKLIRKDPAKKHLPVIAVTAKVLTEDRERCMKAGASDYLARPIDEMQLVRLVGIWTASTQPSAL